jgi:hypothetical protein
MSQNANWLVSVGSRAESETCADGQTKEVAGQRPGWTGHDDVMQHLNYARRTIKSRNLSIHPVRVDPEKNQTPLD